MRLRRTTLAVALLLCSGMPLGVLPHASFAAAETTTAAAPNIAADPIDPDPIDPDPAAPADPLAVVEDAIAGTVGTADTSPDLTLALQQLALGADELSDADRAAADSLLARPTSKLKVCNSHKYGDTVCYRKPNTDKNRQPTRNRTCNDTVCVHWVNSPEATKSGGIAAGDVPDKWNGVPAEDDGAGGRYPGVADNLIPDYVDAVLASMTNVADTYEAAGYRTVLSDGGRGGNNLPDVYLGQIGDLGLYGYCTTDDPKVIESSTPTHRPTWAYCVLDNDYAEGVFSAHTSIENMQVTAAHEYFHAVQYAYDVAEDNWILEATATWAEDFVYDAINDNVVFLRYGPLMKSHLPLDTYSGVFHYGTWIFFRYLTDRFPDAQAGLPVVIRELWESMAHTGTGAKSRYSLQALRIALRERGTTLPSEFADFSAANLRPRATYDEAAANNYPTPRPWKRAKLTVSDPRRTTSFRLDHLASRTLRYLPGSSEERRLRVKVDVGSPRQGAAVIVTSKLLSGGVTIRRLPLSSEGTALKRFDFTRSRVSRIDVTVVNGDSRYRCGGTGDAGVTCQGRPLGDGKAQSVRAALIS